MQDFEKFVETLNSEFQKFIVNLQQDETVDHQDLDYEIIINYMKKYEDIKIFHDYLSYYSEFSNRNEIIFYSKNYNGFIMFEFWYDSYYGINLNEINIYEVKAYTYSYLEFKGKNGEIFNSNVKITPEIESIYSVEKPKNILDILIERKDELDTIIGEYEIEGKTSPYNNIRLEEIEKLIEKYKATWDI